MDWVSSIDISLSGMNFQKLRLDVLATNIANSHTTRTSSGTAYKALEAVATTDFADLIDGNELLGVDLLSGVTDVSVVEKDALPRLQFDPGHPDANGDGYVAYPNIDPVKSMADLVTATRAYEANVRVLNAGKLMALKALEIGGK